MPAARPVHRHPVGLHPHGTARDQRNRTHPALASRPGPPSGTRGAPPIAGRARQCGIPHPARPCATTAARPGSPGQRSTSWPGRSRAAPAAGPSGACRQPRVLGPRLGELPDRSGSPARPCGRCASGRAARRPGSTRTGRGRSGPAEPLPGRGWEQPVPGHTNTLSDGTDISGEVEWRLLPGLKAGDSTPRIMMSGITWYDVLGGAARRGTRGYIRGVAGERGRAPAGCTGGGPTGCAVCGRPGAAGGGGGLGRPG